MKILHCADIHLGYETHGRLDPATGLNTRLLDFKRCFEFLVQRALDEDIDLFLFAGDAYRTADPTPTQQKLFAEALRPIAETGIPIVMIVGNHDHPVSFGKASSVDIFDHLAGDVHVFRKPTRAVIETKAGPLQLIALPWPIRSLLLSKEQFRTMTPHEVRDFIEDRYTAFARTSAEEFEPDVPTVLAAHLTVKGSDLAGSERASVISHEPIFTKGQLTPPGVDYVALGHIHRHQDRNREEYERGEGPPVVYSSSIERISFKERDDDKGFVIVEIAPQPDGGKRTAYAFVETPARRFVAVEVDARETEDPTAAVLDAIAEEDITDAVVRVRYRVKENQIALVDASAIREALVEADTIAAVERVVDPRERQKRTVVRRDSSVKEAMQRYVSQHEHLEDIREDLIAEALDVERAVDGG